jgi:hypothetical protein
MKRFTFDALDDFETFFSGSNDGVTDAIVEGIREAVENKKKTANCFELGFDEGDDFYEVSLPLGEWPKALSACMTKYEQAERYDEAIDTFQLLKEVTELL